MSEMDNLKKDIKNNIKYINNIPIKDEYLFIDEKNQKTKSILKKAKNKSNKYFNDSVDLLNQLTEQNTDYFSNDNHEYEVEMGNTGSMIKYKYGTYINPILYIKYKNNSHYQLLIDFNDKYYEKYPYLSVNRIVFCCDFKYLGFLLELNGDDCNELYLYELDKTYNSDLGYKFLLKPIICGSKTNKIFENIHDFCFIKGTNYLLFSSGTNFLISKNIHFFKINDVLDNNDDFNKLIYNVYEEDTEYSIDTYYSKDYSSFYIVKSDHSRSIKYIIKKYSLNKLLNKIYKTRKYYLDYGNKNLNYYIKDTNELNKHFLQLNKPLNDTLFMIDNIGDNYYILSNILNNNNHLFKFTYNDLHNFDNLINNGDISNYIYIKPHKQNSLVDFYLYKDFIVVNELNMNVDKYFLIPKKHFNKEIIDFSNIDDSKYYSNLNTLSKKFKNFDISFMTKYNEYDNNYIYLNINNAITPNKFIKYFPLQDKYNVINKTRISNFNSSDFIIENRNIKLDNDFKLPTTLFYHKSMKNNQNVKNLPLFITGYGSYGSSFDIGFNKLYLNLLNNNIIIILLHIRGGSENGLNWYLNGKMEHKINTINDFVGGIKYYSNEFNTRNIAIRSRSAGGIIAGSVVNMIPEYIKVVIPEVPFVDLVTTLADKTLPLSEFEYLEFGNPYIENDFNNLMKISPYENIDKLIDKIKDKKINISDLPTVFILAGIQDTRIRYDEPLKYYCKLLDTVYSKNKNNIYIDFNDFGHFGPSKPKEKIKFLSKLQLVIIDNLNL